VGSGTHFAGEMFKAMAAIGRRARTIQGHPRGAYRNHDRSRTVLHGPIANAVGQVKEGKLAALGVSSAERDLLLPQVRPSRRPACRATSLSCGSGCSLVRRPRPIVAKLNREIVRILSDPDAKQRWIPIGLRPQPTTPEGFDKLIRDDVATFTKIARGANIKAE